MKTSYTRNLLKKTLSTPAMLKEIGLWLVESAGSKFYKFAKLVCEKCNFFDNKGQPQINTCAMALKTLEAQGQLPLSEYLDYDPTKQKGRSLHYLESPVPEPENVPESVEAIKQLELSKVKNEQDKLTWQTLIRDEHYLGAALPPGRRVCYLVKSESGILGAISFSSAANKLKAREEWIGWTNEERQQQLDCIVNMTRFLIRKNVKCHNLASKVLSMATKAVVEDFFEDYGFKPLLAETFVDSEKYAGTCYLAAGWEKIGLTKGRGWNDRHTTAKLSKKIIFVKPLQDDFRAQLTITQPDKTPTWVNQGALDIAKNLTEENWSEIEFSGANLGHKDRVACLIRCAKIIAKSITQSITAAFEGSRAAARAWYHLITANPDKVTFKSILNGHYESTYRRMLAESQERKDVDARELGSELIKSTNSTEVESQKKDILIIQDDTTLNFTSKPNIKNLGPIASNQTGAVSSGFLVHTSIAVTPEGIPLGIVKANCFTRQPKSNPNCNTEEKNINKTAKKSFNWIEHARYINKFRHDVPNAWMITVCDRCADIATDEKNIKETQKEKNIKKTTKEKESFNWIEHARYINKFRHDVPNARMITVFYRGADISTDGKNIEETQKKKNIKKTAEEKESFNWIEHARHINEIGQYIPNARMITVCDRGADIALLIYECAENNHCELLVRAQKDLSIPGETESLFKLMNSIDASGTIEVEVQRKSARPKLSGKNAVQKRDARTATLSIVYRKVKILPPPERKGQNPIEIWAVSAIERNPPEGVKGITWHLLTTLPVNNFEDAVKCVKYYKQRWVIEEFHRVLKSGCKVESLDYANVERVQCALAVYMVIAWRIMILLKTGREHPELPAEVILDDLEIKVLKKHFQNEKKRAVTNVYNAVVLISKLGGYLDRKNDPPPGYQAFWTGYRKLQFMCIGVVDMFS